MVISLLKEVLFEYILLLIYTNLNFNNVLYIKSVYIISLHEILQPRLFTLELLFYLIFKAQFILGFQILQISLNFIEPGSQAPRLSLRFSDPYVNFKPS